MTAWLLLLTLSGCRDWPDYAGAFDVPTALGVLQPENGGPFREPIGFVGSQHGGQISMLALKQGTFLADDPTALFLRGNPLATGKLRILSAVVPHAEPDGTVTVFAFDRAFGQLLEIPYITGYDDQGFPIEPATTVSEPVFDDADGSGDAPVLTDLVVKTGWTTSETWTIRFDGEVWRTRGSRSGEMPGEAHPGEPFVGVDRMIAFTVEGEATAGDVFTVTTDAHVVEHELEARVLDARPAPDQSLVAVVLVRHDTDRPEVRFLDPLDPGALADAEPLALPTGSAPGRVAWDAASERLFVADQGFAAVWQVTWPDPSDRSAYQIDRIDLPFPVLDVAPLLTEVGRQIFVVPLEGDALWTLDLDTGLLKDVDPWRPGTQGLTFTNPVRGIEAMPIPYLQLEGDDDGNRDFGRSVAVALTGGSLVFADERTGCLVADLAGPQSNVSGLYASSIDYTRSFESTAPYGAFLQANDANSRHVLGNPCPGITRTQSWTLTYDALQQGWVVRGTLSGRQATLAREDVRYISDDGEVSFLIRSGQTPSVDDWTLSFRMVEGLTRADGDTDGDPRLLEIPIESPSDPVYFHYEVGPRTGGWYPVDDRPHVLVGSASNDLVGRIDPQEGIIDASWD